MTPLPPPTSIDNRAWARLVLLCVALFGLNLLIPRDLWVQDEARYGEIVREMLAGGDWLIPHLNGYPYPDKPVLYFWLVAALAKIVGQGEFAFRLLSALSTLLAVAGIHRLGRTLTDNRVGFWAAALFATSWLGLIGGHMMRMDMLLVAAAVYAWWALHRHRTDGGARHLVAFWGLTALALAIKGPITLLFTLAPGLAWLATTQGWRGLRSIHPVTGMAALIGLVAAWVLAVVLTGHDDYLRDIWHKQLVGRAIDSWSHREPFYFYLWVVPLGLLPWTLLAWQGERRLRREQIALWRELACFTAVPLLGLSLISGKLVIYPLPLLPGLCVAAALAAVELREKPRVPAWLGWPPALCLLLPAGAVLWLSRTQLDANRVQGLAVGVGLLALTAVGLWLVRAEGQRWLHGWLGLSAGFAWLLFGTFAYLVNPLFSARALGAAVARHAPPGSAAGAVNATRGILNYYAGRTLVELDRGEAGAWLAAHPGALLIVKTRDIERVFGASGIPASCRVHETYTFEFKEYHVVAGC